MTLEPGLLIDERYEILRPIGQGAMASAWLAVDHLSLTKLVLKTLPAPHAHLLQALRQEFAFLIAFAHPALLKVHDFGSFISSSPAQAAPQRVWFYTADFVDGLSLNDYARGRSWSDLSRVFRNLFEGLRVLHQAKIRHGDIKPSNVIVTNSDTATLIDLGCAGPLLLPPQTIISGTQSFIAPELLAGQASDQRADLYACGVTLQRVFELTPKTPPDSIRALAARLTAPNPADRPVNIDEVLESLGLDPACLPPALDRLGQIAGRSAQLEKGREFLNRVRNRLPSQRVLHITGVDGVGKSRFIRELKWDAQQSGSCFEAHFHSPRSIRKALCLALKLPELDQTLSSMLSALASLPTKEWPSTILFVDDLDRFPSAEQELLLAVARSLESSAPFAIVMAECAGLALDAPSVAHIELGPLSPDDLSVWLSPALEAAAIAKLAESTGGFPERIQIELRRPTPLSFDPCLSNCSAGSSALSAQLSSAAKRALATLYSLQGDFVQSESQSFGISTDDLLELHEIALLSRDGESWKLAPMIGDSAISPIVGESTLSEIRLALADSLLSRASSPELPASFRSKLKAKAARCLTLAGKIREAEAVSLDASLDHAHCPLLWSQSLSLLRESSTNDALLLALAKCEIALGKVQEGLDHLTPLLSASQPDIRSNACLEVALGSLRIGNTEYSVQLLTQLLSQSPEPQIRAVACDSLARAAIRQARYADAISFALQGLSLAASPEARASLLCSAGIAHSYLGAAVEAQRNLLESVDLLADGKSPADLFRAHSGLGIHAYREGNLSQAADSHALALAVAEKHDLYGSIATAALNMGTVLHQQARWLEAQRAYQRGLRIAVAVAQSTTELWLRYNLAKLHTDLGQFDRAAKTAEKCGEQARLLDNIAVVAACDAVLAEIAALRGDSSLARRLFKNASEVFLRLQSPWEAAELELQLAEVELSDAAPAAANLSVARAKSLINQANSSSKDILLRFTVLEAKCLVALGRTAGIATKIETCIQEARSLGLAEAEAEMNVILASIWQLQGADSTARRYRLNAQQLWERTAANLDPAAREAFWSHPRRSPLRFDESEPKAGSRLDAKYRVVLELNKRINSSLSVDEVLERAMDCAVELMGAERGFLLLTTEATPPALHVAVARNVDKEKLVRSHMKFSHSIAERVIASGEPVLTMDAQSDLRFSAELSVHSMLLQSVVCVPVRSRRGILGALYLDNRFRRGRFQVEDLEILQAFADQVAIALSNARLHSELEKRNRELDEERSRVSALLQNQAVELDRLHEEVRETRRLNHRHHFGPIVAHSASMQRVLDLLDRVVDTTVPVLVQGESGTGKELIARAIHEHGESSTLPFIAINCGAMPASLLEDELFGHEKGAFTGADRSREGLFVLCKGGTLFLDEIGELPLAMQVKLLRVLQEREVRPLGSSATIAVKFRLVCATNRKLCEEVAAGNFREDLYYRINAVEIQVPPLRERIDDITALAERIVSRACDDMKRPKTSLTTGAVRMLTQYFWPGNVRQLENVLLRAIILSDSDRLEAAHLDLPLAQVQQKATGRDSFEATELFRILKILELHRWNISKALPEIGIPRATLYRILKRNGALSSRGKKSDG